jgi:hypothetical protein
MYRSAQSYIDWLNAPVLTTVNTTAYPVKLVDFPAVTICGQGMSADVFTTGMIKTFLKYLATSKNISYPDLTPIVTEDLVYTKEKHFSVLMFYTYLYNIYIYIYIILKIAVQM